MALPLTPEQFDQLAQKRAKQPGLSKEAIAQIARDIREWERLYEQKAEK